MRINEPSSFQKYFLFPLIVAVVGGLTVLFIHDMVKEKPLEKQTQLPEKVIIDNEKETKSQTLNIEKPNKLQNETNFENDLTNTELDNINTINDKTLSTTTKQEREFAAKNKIVKTNEIEFEFSNEYWKRKYFKPVKKDTWNVIVRSLGSDYNNSIKILDKMRNQYPNFHFRLTSTVAKDGRSNSMYAIYFGNGLSKEEASEAVSIAKKYGVAKDAYAVIQYWDTGGEYQ